MSNSLTDAFAQFGARPKHPLRDRSAIADDGALVLGCASPFFKHPNPGVLRYEDMLSRASTEGSSAAFLGEHLIQARDGKLPVRMIVIAEVPGGKPRYRIFARPDVVGRLVEFDGNRFVVDFRRVVIEANQTEIPRKRRS